jgi:hypothetical protein
LALETLCLKCGLCCDGTLFTHVALSKPERERLGMEVLRQPCTRLEKNGCCSIYASRPGGCATFVCMLGRALEDGEVQLDEALQIVAEARSARLKIDALVPGPGSPLHRARQYEADGEDAEVAVRVRDLRRALESISRRHFLGRQPK